MIHYRKPELFPHRCFFGGWGQYLQPGLWTTPQKREAVTNILERHLKILALTQTHVVVPIKHLLVSPFAHDLVLRSPGLFSSGVLVGATQEKAPRALEHLELKRAQYKNEKHHPYHSPIAGSVAYLIDERGLLLSRPAPVSASVERNATLASDLENPHSVVRQWLGQEGLTPPVEFIQVLRDQAESSPLSLMARQSSPLPGPLLRSIQDYLKFETQVELAQAWSCDTVLPQSQVIDYSMMNLAQSKSVWSVRDSFIKIFIDSLRTRTGPAFPVDFLDSLSIDEVIALRGSVICPQFHPLHQALEQKTQQLLQGVPVDQLNLLMVETEELALILEETFQQALKDELNLTQREEKRLATGRILHLEHHLLPWAKTAPAQRGGALFGLNQLRPEAWSQARELKRKGAINACSMLLDQNDCPEKPILQECLDRMARHTMSRMSGNY